MGNEQQITPRDQVRTWKRGFRKEIRLIERDLNRMQYDEKDLLSKAKRFKKGRPDMVKVYAKRILKKRTSQRRSRSSQIRLFSYAISRKQKVLGRFL